MVNTNPTYCVIFTHRKEMKLILPYQIFCVLFTHTIKYTFINRPVKQRNCKKRPNKIITMVFPIHNYDL